MKYSYILTSRNGVKQFNIQDYHFTEEEMLRACEKSDSEEFNTIVKVKFHKSIPNGYHLCGCGNLVKGNKDELCQECREIYGHKYESEL